MKKIKKCDYFELVIWLSHYHSGQWSRGYRLMSKLMGNNSHWTSNAEKQAEQSEIYQYLTQNYAKTV